MPEDEDKFTGTFKSNIDLAQKYHVEVEMEEGKVTSATLHRINFVTELPERTAFVPSEKDFTRIKEMLALKPPVNQVGQELTKKQITEALDLLKAQIPKQEKEMAKN